MKKILSMIMMIVCTFLLCTGAICGAETPKETGTQAQETKTGNRVCFAAPLFSQSEKDFNEILSEEGV